MKWRHLALLALAGGASAAEFERIEVRRDDEVYSVAASAVLAAHPDDIYAVVTDYNHLHRITGAIRMSIVLDRPEPGIAVVFVRSRACFAVFCKTLDQVQLADAREREHLVVLALPAYSDVRLGRTDWWLEPIGNTRTRVRWEMRMVPDFWVPPLIGAAMIHSGLEREGRDMINGIEKLANERARR